MKCVWGSRLHPCWVIISWHDAGALLNGGSKAAIARAAASCDLGMLAGRCGSGVCKGFA